MVLGVGVDILLIDRIGRASVDLSDPFIRKTFTQAEREQAVKRDDPTQYFATRFAGKEAVYKSLGIDVSRGALCEIEILNDEKGAPSVILHGELLEIAKEKGISRVMISLSYDTDYAIAYATALANERMEINDKTYN
ncbi:MAG: holo-ACP synthase [Defluviitaleaceae bacterium]|nr:holo-ACP synthase [Defluviitaleaceae bacterium]